MNVLRFFTSSVAINGKFATFGYYKKFKVFIQKPIFFFWKNRIIERFKNVTTSNVVYGKFANLSDFKIFKTFLKSLANFFEKNSIFRSFEKFSIFQSHSTAKMLTLAFFKKNSQFLSKNPSIFHLKTQIVNVSRNFTSSIGTYGKIVTISTFKRVNFFSKNTSIFYENSEFLNVLSNFTNSFALYGKLATFGFNETVKILFRKNHLFFSLKKPIGWTCWEFLLVQS